MTTVFHARTYGRFIETQSNLRRKKLHRTNQGSNFLGSSLSNKDNVIFFRAFEAVASPLDLESSWQPRYSTALCCQIQLPTNILICFKPFVLEMRMEEVLSTPKGIDSLWSMNH